MRYGTQPAVDAWRRLAGAPPGGRVQIVHNPESWLAPSGYVGIVTIADTITVTVPRAELVTIVEDALSGLTGAEAGDADVVLSRLPPATATLGPAELFYPPDDFIPAAAGDDDAHHRSMTPDELSHFVETAKGADLEESGIAHIESPAFVSRTTDGAVASACGYRRWPNGVAHLSVLTHAQHRRLAHARSAAAAAIAHAVSEGLLPQWRARPLASQRLAVALGLTHMGTQLSVQLALIGSA